MKRIRLRIATTIRAKELKAIFSEKLGFNVHVKKGSGSMKTFYRVTSGAKYDYKFTDTQAEIVRQTLVELNAFGALLDSYEDPKQVIHCISGVWFTEAA